jgi:hypothetical protein
MGVKDEVDTMGKQISPSVPFKEIFKRFFSRIRYTASEPSTSVATKLPIIRFLVHRDDLHQAKMTLRDRGREIRNLGWWVAQECPKELRDMETNAFRFFMELKKKHSAKCPALKRHYLEVSDGFLKAGGTPLVPVFSIPNDVEKWPKLAPILNKMIEEVMSCDWVSRFKKPKPISQALYDEWGDITEPREGEDWESAGDDSDGPGDSDSDSEDEEKEDEGGKDTEMSELGS